MVNLCSALSIGKYAAQNLQQKKTKKTNTFGPSLGNLLPTIMETKNELHFYTNYEWLPQYEELDGVPPH